MKLYTEEQVRMIYEKGIYNGSIGFENDIENITCYYQPIELPDNNEDAGKIALYISSVRDEKQAVFFVAGAMKYNEWIKNQIINQNK